jgi:hypothetical protein
VILQLFDSGRWGSAMESVRQESYPHLKAKAAMTMRMCEQMPKDCIAIGDSDFGSFESAFHLRCEGKACVLNVKTAHAFLPYNDILLFLTDLRDGSLHKDTTGRGIYNALRGAAVSQLQEEGSGLVAEAARTLGIARCSV